MFDSKSKDTPYMSPEAALLIIAVFLWIGGFFVGLGCHDFIFRHFGL